MIGRGWLDDGNIEFLGRIDHQVKLRGFRIRGDIEAALNKYTAVKEAVVTVREDENGDGHYLCGYIVSDEEIYMAGLREYLAGNLPGYMIPAHFVQIEKFPLTLNGKVDIKALPVPGFKVGGGLCGPLRRN